MGFFWDSYLALILTGSQLWSYSVCQRPPLYVYTSPSVTVQQGLCVHVQCSFIMPRRVQLSTSITGIWCHLYYGHEHQRNGPFFLTGNVASGDCSYSIEDPLPIDEEIYYFTVEGDGLNTFTYPASRTYVHVTELTDRPTISSTRLVDGEEVTLTCTSPGRCRNIRPQITWEGAMTGVRQKMYNIIYEDRSRTFHSNITFTPRKSHNNSPLSCKVTFKPNLSTVEKRTLNVEYFPSMKITREGDDTDDITAVDVKDGDSITMKCIVDSNPKASITWYKEDMAVQRAVTLTLINITPGVAGRYRCSAENEHGAAHRTVEITYYNNLEKEADFTKFHFPADGESNHIIYIILLSAIGTICLLLFALLAFVCWRKRQKKTTNVEMEFTYSDLRRSDIASTYDQLKPEIPADTNVIGSDVVADNGYENVQRKNVSK